MRLLYLLLAAMSSSAQQYQLNEQIPLQYSTPCALLEALFPGQVAGPHQEAYIKAQATYWLNQQAEIAPSCRFFPHGARDIQIALADVILPSNTSIAIASGGHSTVNGASNIDQGITFDLSKLSGVAINEHENTATIGPGARWRDIYPILQKQNLTVAGGRVGHVAVGGYVLGGGFSWFANQYGWTCDSVIEFEVVTPRAEILWVNAGQHEDIFWALKGSLGAFGIVTKIKMPTIPSTSIYAGALSYKQEYVPKLCAALESLTLKTDDELATQGYLSFIWREAEQRFENEMYMVNTDGDTSSNAIGVFKAIPHMENGLRSTTIGESVVEVDQTNPLGFRRFKFAITSTLTTSAMLAMHEIVQTFVAETDFDPTGVLDFAFQPLPSSHLKKSQNSNIFNLDASQGPLILVAAEFWWTNGKRDEYFKARALEFQRRLEAKLRELNALHSFAYPNYASREQRPFNALTPVTKRMLQAIRLKYDPHNDWQKLVPGLLFWG